MLMNYNKWSVINLENFLRNMVLDLINIAKKNILLKWINYKIIILKKT